MRHRLAWAVAVVTAMAALPVVASTVYVDSRSGNDANPGTREKPLRTIGRAAELVRTRTESGPTTISIAPGVYCLSEAVEFDTKRPYTNEERLVIEALFSPDDPQWTPMLVPVILSAEDPRKPDQLNAQTETYGFQIKISHVTIRGLKFLGNPLVRNWHCPVSRIGNGLEDLVVTQCMFVGDPNGLDVYCGALTTGDKFVVEHCIFSACHASVVFWDGPDGIPGKGNVMRYCIVDSMAISGVWTCQTADDLEFHHNIVTRSEYFWLRARGTPIKYSLHDCIVTDNKYYSGYGTPSGATGQTGPEVTYSERNVTKEGQVRFEKDKNARNYLHIVPGTLASDLKAGLFKK